LRGFIGSAYYWPAGPAVQTGNDDPVVGFDCSGLVSEGLRSIGAIGAYERLSSGQIAERFAACRLWRKGSMKAPPLQAGDILVYGSSAADLYHVAVAVSDWQIIEAGGGRQGIDTPAEAAAANAFVRLRPATFRDGELQLIIRLEA
jgi:cell wall-associated NlpC family hydrolase